jgi:hypothetical protein
MLVRRGTHRIAAAQILGLQQVTGIVTKIDRRFAEAAVRKAPGIPVPEAILRGVQQAVAA